MISEVLKYYEFTKMRRRQGSPSFDGDIPENWRRIFYKSYPRFPSIGLDISEPSLALKDLASRQTVRGFTSEALCFSDLSNILFWSAGIKPKQESDMPKRMYPSAGARYPVELYVIVENVQGLQGSLYHYNVLDNSLEQMLGERSDVKSIDLFCQDDLFPVSTLCLTGVLSRTEVKYGAQSYRFALIEAGHIGQNVCLLSQSLGVGCCPVGGFDNDKLVKLLDLVGSEVPLYLFALGKTKID